MVQNIYKPYLQFENVWFMAWFEPEPLKDYLQYAAIILIYRLT